MLRLAVVFLVIALVSMLLGLPGVAALSMDAARLLFMVFLILAIVLFVGNFLRGTPPRDII